MYVEGRMEKRMGRDGKLGEVTLEGVSGGGLKAKGCNA